MIKITWEELGKAVITDKNIKCLAIGKDYSQYEGNFTLNEFVDFLNFQQNRKIQSDVKILNVELVSLAVERETINLDVIGSNPARGATWIDLFTVTAVASEFNEPARLYFKDNKHCCKRCDKALEQKGSFVKLCKCWL